MIAVIYSAASGRVRRWVVSDERSLDDIPVAEGEAKLQAEGKGHDLNTLQALVTKATGKTPTNDRFAVIDAEGNVTGAIYACPACGDKAEHLGAARLVRHATAGAGWKYDGTSFTAPPQPAIDYDATIAELEARKAGASQEDIAHYDAMIASVEASR